MEYLSPEDHRSLVFVSKSINPFAELFILRKIAWGWDPIPVRRVLLLFRAILRKPERAHHVRHFRLLADEKFYDTDTLWPEIPRCEIDCKQEIARFPDVLEHAQGVVKTTEFPDANTWIHALENGNPFAFVSILLSQLHNLRSLSLDYSFIWKSGFPGLMLRHALSSPSKQLSRFDLLTRVDYGSNIRRDSTCWWPVDGQLYPYPEVHAYPECNPEQFPAWFYLPALRSLKIWLRTKQGIELPHRCAPDLSRLERLVLSRATIYEAQVPGILSLAPSLKTLHLGMAYHWGKETALKDGAAIIEGLKYSKETLTNLSFGIEYYPPSVSEEYLSHGEYELSKPFYGLLTQFKNLRFVEVPVNILVGWSMEPSSDLVSVLPEGVEGLCLRADYSGLFGEVWHEEQVTELVRYNLRKLKSYMPRLDRVWVRIWENVSHIFEDYEDDVLPRVTAVSDAFEKEDIYFQIWRDQLGNGLWTENHLNPNCKFIC